MSWLRQSDTANDHDAMTAPLAWDPDPTWPTLDAAQDMGLMALLLRGLLSACAVHLAGAEKYTITKGAIAKNAIVKDWRLLAQLLERAGAWRELPDGSGYELIDDPKGFYHIVTEAQRQWQSDRRADVSNKRLTVQVRYRDGDGCRFCAKIVIRGGDKKSSLAATYHHIIPGQRARTIDELVVACKGCNSAIKDNAEKLPLLDPPANPFYLPETVDFLAKAGVPVEAGARPAAPADTARSTTARPATAADPARRDPASSPAADSTTGPEARPATADPARRDPAPGGTPRSEPSARPAPGGHRAPRPGPRPDPAPRSKPVDQADPRSADPADPVAEGSGFAGSGPGRVGSGAPDHPPGDPSAQNQARSLPRSRRRRARRSKPSKGATP